MTQFQNLSAYKSSTSFKAPSEKDRHYQKVGEVYETVHDILAREYGVFWLGNGNEDKAEGLIKFFLTTEDAEKALDVIEMFFRAIDTVARNSDYKSRVEGIKATPDDAIAELNARFLEHGVGYRFESREIIRIDSEFLHAEAVKPALMLLRGKSFKGANDEFLTAHEHYRHGRYKETLNECLKALESTLKVICHKRNWTHSENDTAKNLLDICFGKELIPAYLQSEFSSLRATLESGVPTIRNKQAGLQSKLSPENLPA